MREIDLPITVDESDPGVTFTLDELETFSCEQILARAREVYGPDWKPSWMLRREQAQAHHA